MLTDEHFVQHHAQCEEVGTRVDALPLHLFRRHVAGGTEEDAGHRPIDCLSADSKNWSFARPKSRIFTLPSSRRNVFAGFRSR